jgi:hypothetical protein
MVDFKIKLKKKPLIIDESNFSLVGLTHHAIKQKQIAWEKSADRKHYTTGFHLSSKLNLAAQDPRYCARELEIMRRFADTLPPWRPDPDLQVVLDIGTEAHSLTQKYWRDLGIFEGDKVGFYGTWACRRCSHQWEDFAPVECPKCDAEVYELKYLEYRFNNRKWDIKSTTDGLLWIYNSAKDEWFEYVCEIKTIKQSGFRFGDIGFNELTEPITKHYNQAQGYAWCRYLEHRKGITRKLPKGFSEWPTFKKKIIFFYINKNGGKPTFKEYWRDLDKEAWRLITGRITEIRADEANDQFAPRLRKCENVAAGRKICDVADVCFRV